MAFAVAGWASRGDPVHPKDEAVSPVYGYLDMQEAPVDLAWVCIKQYVNNRDEDNSVSARDGVFMHVGVEPGSYQVATDGGSRFMRGDFEYDFGSKGRNRTATRITKPGVYFFGSFQYVNHAGKGFFSADKFEMRAAKGPSEKEVLQKVINRLDT